MPKILAENRRAKFDYEILEKYGAGIELTGQEVKSAKSGHFGLAGSYAIPRNGEIWLINSQIPPYQEKNAPRDYDFGRSRRLLLTHGEIKEITGRLNQKSVNLIPLSAYLKNNFIKIELALGQRRKKTDKRDYLKKKSAEREIKKIVD